MSELKAYLERAGFTDVLSYINSGNILLKSDIISANKIEEKIENLISENFRVDSELIEVVALTHRELQKVIDNAPEGFGEQSDKYHSDVLFPIDVSAGEIFAQTEINPEVDKAWLGNKVVYYQRLSSLRTRSKLSKIISKPIYKNITIRSWQTVKKLADLSKSG